MSAESAVPGVTFCSFVPRPAATLVLYGFPYAGANASAYRPWGDVVPPSIEVRAVQPAGRSGAFSAVVDRLADAVATDVDDRPFAFFGHSMGALVAFETARELARRGDRGPERLAISARPAPDRPRELVLHGRSDAELLTTAVELGGVPPEVVDHPDLARLAMRMLQRDLALLRTYRYVEDPLLACPFSLFGATHDALASEDDVAEWARLTTGPVTRRTYAGGHFYLRSQLDVVVGHLVGDLGLDRLA